MKGRAEVFRLKQQLDGTFRRVSQVDPSELELLSDFARYLCVLVSGFLEKSIQELAMNCCRRMSSGPALNYAISQLEWTRNPTVDNVLTLVAYFSPEWRDQLESFWSGERKEAVGSVVGLRHAIAHGGSPGVTYARSRQYYERVAQVIEFLANVFEPM